MPAAAVRTLRTTNDGPFPGTGLALRAVGRRGAAQPAGGARIDPGTPRRGLAEALRRLLRSRLHGLGRLHGPRELGHRPRRRIEVRLHAPVSRHAVQPDGDPAAGARGEARHRHGPRPRPSLPRQLPDLRQRSALARVRAGDHRLRSGRGYRDRHRAPIAVRNPAGRRRALCRRSTRSCSSTS